MKMELFHRIGPGGDESARVRKFIADAGLSLLVEFSNVNYDEANKRWSAVSQTIPCLVADGRVFNGTDAIIEFLRQAALAP